MSRPRITRKQMLQANRIVDICGEVWHRAGGGPMIRGSMTEKSFIHRNQIAAQGADSNPRARRRQPCVGAADGLDLAAGEPWPFQSGRTHEPPFRVPFLFATKLKPKPKPKTEAKPKPKPLTRRTTPAPQYQPYRYPQYQYPQ